MTCKINQLVIEEYFKIKVPNNMFSNLHRKYVDNYKISFVNYKKSAGTK